MNFEPFTAYYYEEEYELSVSVLFCNEFDTVTCRAVRATKMAGSSSDDWIY
jgi:hypothetical protein